MNIDNIIMLHYNKICSIVLGAYQGKDTQTINLTDALHITKKHDEKIIRKNKVEKYSDFEFKKITWQDNMLSVDKGFNYKPQRGKTSWGLKDLKIYTDKQTILSILEFYQMNNLVDYLKK